MRRAIVRGFAALDRAGGGPAAQQQSLDDFFREFSDGWVRLNPNLAVATRYFTGDEQDRLNSRSHRTPRPPNGRGASTSGAVLRS